MNLIKFKQPHAATIWTTHNRYAVLPEVIQTFRVKVGFYRLIIRY
jgi:hypothetical protein